MVERAISTGRIHDGWRFCAGFLSAQCHDYRISATGQTLSASQAPFHVGGARRTAAALAMRVSSTPSSAVGARVSTVKVFAGSVRVTAAICPNLAFIDVSAAGTSVAEITGWTVAACDGPTVDHAHEADNMLFAACERVAAWHNPRQ